jgi:hypothetical protein
LIGHPPRILAGLYSVACNHVAGEMLRDMAETGERARQHDDRYRESHAATLADLGVNKSQSSRWQKLAAGAGRSVRA